MGWWLKDRVYLVRGAKNAALYDFVKGRIFWIQGDALDDLIKGDRDRWQALKQMGLAEESDDESKEARLQELEPSFVINEKILPRFIWFEINGSQCNERCIHCYVENARSNASFIPLSPKLSASDWKRVIAEAADLGFSRAQFIGGEPFMWRGDDGEDVLDLAEWAINKGFKFIEIFSNGTLLTEEKVKRIADLKISMAVSLFSIDAQVHDSITRVAGSWKQTMKGLERLRKFKVPTRVEVVVMRQNSSTLKKTLEWIERQGFSHKVPDPIRPVGGIFSWFKTLAPPLEYYTPRLITQPEFRVSAKEIMHNLRGNPCLQGKLVVTERGGVYPCIFDRYRQVGNVLQQTLGEIIQSEVLEAVWRMSKRDIFVCKDCEFRYVCNDCRPLAAAFNGGDYLAPFPYCAYNPYTGEWGRGVWRKREGEFAYVPLSEFFV